MPKCDFNKVARHGCSTINLLLIFRTPFTKNTSGWLPLLNLILISLCDAARAYLIQEEFYDNGQYHM